ncbi:MAG: type 1 glutamine amidotransferase [Candidatus Cloacimonetes bacterium]|nr:type 1 glutamine amidotransferase [Candidatus Cloacimonadota bacterium]
MKALKTLKGIIISIAAIATFALVSCAPEIEEPVEVSANYVPENPHLDAKGRILIITENNFNDLELFYPLYRFIEEGYAVTVASLEGTAVVGYNSAPLPSTTPIEQIEPEFYQALYLPGGRAPQLLRRDERVLEVVRHFVETNKPIGAICHGPQILISAGVVEGKRIAAWPGIAEEVTDASAQFINEATVVDGQFVTARKPGDLPTHLYHFMNLIR